MADVIAVCSSARRHGNSEHLLDNMLEGMASQTANIEVQKVVPREMSITPCRSCNACWETGECVVQDEMQNMYTRFCEADHVILATPIYFTSLPGHAKVFIDRFQCFWVRTYRLGKPPEPEREGAFLCVGAMDRKNYFQCTSHIVKTWFSTLNITCQVSRFYPDLDAKDDVLDRDDHRESARRAGEELIQLSQ